MDQEGSTTQTQTNSPVFILQSKFLLPLALLFVFGLGFGLRLFDLTDAPLDFHPWRQLRAASITRGKYYAMLPNAEPETREKAVTLGKRFVILEPKVFETLVAYSYKLVGGEYLWLARLYAILFWIIGGIALYLLARRITNDDGALVSLAFYLFVPFGFTGSRAFLPEPLMIMWIMLAAYALYRWIEERTWKWTILSGLFSGIAVYIKILAVFPITCMAVFLVLTAWGLKKAIKNPKVWCAALLMAMIPTPYYLLGLSRSYSPSEYLQSWFFSFSYLLTQEGFYIRWMSVLDVLVGLTILFPSIMGMLLLKREARMLSLGMWVGYVLTGISVPSLILSHTYYNLPLVPIMALSLAPLGELLFSKISTQPRFWQLFFVGVTLLSISYPIVVNRNSLVARNYRLEARGWEELGAELPDGKIIGITHDYNTRLNYYGWRFIAPWPNASDISMDILSGEVPIFDDPAWRNVFEEKTRGYDYFIVTVFNELEAQPVLRSTLYENFTVVTEDNRYILFDLRSGNP